MQNIWKYLERISLVTFYIVNQAVKFIVSNFILKPFNALLLCLALGVLALFFALTAGLNFNLFGTQYTFGSDLSNGVLGAVESGWTALISLVKSYEPSSILGFPLEILTETLAVLLNLLSVVIPVLIETALTIFSLLLRFGIVTVIEVVSWTYLIGFSIWIYHKFADSSEQPAEAEAAVPERIES